MKKRLTSVIEKNRFVLLVLLVGVLLMLLPTGKADRQKAEQTAESGYSPELVERELEEILSYMDGVGKVKVMLSLKSGSTLQLAADEQSDLRDSETRQEKQVVKLSRGSGQQEVVVTEEIYPTYLGAVIVCEGGDNSETKLRVIEAVSVVTSLSSDRISVVKWEDEA